jgi:hypothetical protein
VFRRFLDSKGILRETAGVNRPFLLLVLTFLCAGLSVAQQPLSQTPMLAPGEPHLAPPQIDSAKILAGISATYYHADDLSGMDCGAVIDWESVMKQLKQPAPEDRMKILKGMNMEVHARRGKATEVTVAWSNGEPTNKQTLEDGAKQMLGGFFQMYWPIAGASMAPTKADSVRGERREGGGYVLHFSAAGTNTSEEVDNDLVPTKVYVSSSAMNAEMTLHFSPSPKPIAGDLRRLTALDVATHVGTSTMNAGFNIEYQTVGGYHVPQRFSVDVGGAYAVPVELIGCSVSREITVAPPSK